MTAHQKSRPDIPLAQSGTPVIASRPKRNRTAASHMVCSARDAIGPIEHGCEKFLLTNGQFSISDIIEYVIDRTGPADVDLATWTAADGDLRRAHAMLLSKRFRSIRMVVDPSFKTRKPEFCDTLVGLFGADAIRTTPLHGKFVNIRNDEWSIAIRTSMNLNPNKRIETVEISDCAVISGALASFVDQLWLMPVERNFLNKSAKVNAERSNIKSGLAF